ncbi:MAG: class I adenylate-forming enzyme family protein [Myxococcota bacterium]
MMLDSLRTLAQEQGQQTAIDDGQSSLTFAELFELVGRWADRLKSGAVVVGVLPGGPALTALGLACLSAKAVFVPLPKKATVRELRRFFALTQPDLIATAADRSNDIKRALGDRTVPCVVPRLDNPAFDAPGAPQAPLPDDVAMVQFTSGSTGAPKGLLLTEAGIAAGIQQNQAFLERWRGCAIFSPMPQFHAMGGAVALEHLLFGTSVLVTNKFVPGDDRKRIEAADVRALVASPSYARMLLRLGMFKKLTSVRAIGLGSAASEPALLSSLRKARADLSFHLRYGLSESFGSLTRLDVEVDAPLPPAGLVGPALEGVKLAPLPSDPQTPDEIRASSAANAAAQLTGPGQWTPLADKDGYLATGDFGFLQPDGLHLSGRKSQFIKRNGHRIDPSEIEQVLVAHPEINEAAVVGLPDPIAGTKIVAMAEGEVDTGTLDAFCRDALSDHKVPQRFVRVDEIPKTASGKPDRQQVKAELLEE